MASSSLNAGCLVPWPYLFPISPFRWISVLPLLSFSSLFPLFLPFACPVVIVRKVKHDWNLDPFYSASNARSRHYNRTSPTQTSSFIVVVIVVIAIVVVFGRNAGSVIRIKWIDRSGETTLVRWKFVLFSDEPWRNTPNSVYKRARARRSNKSNR